MATISDAVQLSTYPAPQTAVIASFPAPMSPEQRLYLTRGLTQPGGKLPLFDIEGRPVHRALVRSCIASGWVEPWFINPLKPDWLVCKLTEKGRRAITPQ